MGVLKVMAIPYKNFKERIAITKKYKDTFHIENMGNYLYLIRRELDVK